MTIQKLVTISILALLGGILSGCVPVNDHAMQDQMAQQEAQEMAAMVDAQRQAGRVLVAVMTPTAGNKAQGTVTFTGTKGGIQVDANISGLSPGDHAIHIHQYGDLRKNDGKGTGGHYNPEGHDHALPSTEMRHAGDLGNLSADADGNASYSITIDNVTLDGTHNPIIGRGVIIHAKVDDGGQPTGNAGARVSQGVIGYSQPSDG
ncbi:MAG: superoxide dismutase family protein [Planctomycetota bacterium]|nr:superoxide dismutase family protein [Planctomycetota bacterium]